MMAEEKPWLDKGVFIGTITDLAYLALPVLTGVAVTMLLAWVVARVTKAGVPANLWPIPAAFAILGGIAGAIAGSSNEALVSGLVTGIIGIVTACLTYIFAQDSQPEIKAALPYMLILLLLNTLVGLAVGQNWKRQWDNYAIDMEQHRIHRDQIWVPTSREYQQAVMKKCVEQNEGFQEARTACAFNTLFPDG